MKLFKEIEFPSPPIMVAAWPGMGNVGIIATDYLRTRLGAVLFAEIDMSPFFIPDSIIVKEGIAQLPDIPSAVFNHLQDPPVIIFESNAQVGGKDGIAIIQHILAIAERFHVSRIYTAAAFAQPMSHSTPSIVLGACNQDSLLDHLKEKGVTPMPDGYIAGLNGLVLGVAASRGVEACCFLGTIPSYASSLSYPKASLEIVKTMGSILDREIDTAELEQSVVAMDKQLAAIEERIREYIPTAMEGSEEQMPEMNDDEVPRYIMDKIEELFVLVKNDRSQGNRLKEELDRWKLYELYEHRFLDLFKEHEDK